MIDDDKPFFEKMALLYPALTEKAEIDNFDQIGSGWHGIFEEMLEVICYKYSAACSYLQYASRHETELITECKGRVEEEAKKLPVIMQVKEKYGTLRIYSSNNNERTLAAIEFAELLSARTCEWCGRPGFLSNRGPQEKTLCKEHHHENGSL